MTKEMLQAIYTEASEAALDIRADYRDLEAELKEIKEEMRELAEKGAHQEAIVYLALEAGAVDTEGWRDNREEDDDWSDDEDDDWSDEEDNEDENEEDNEDEDEEDEDIWYDPCYDCGHDCHHCAINN